MPTPGRTTMMSTQTTSPAPASPAADAAASASSTAPAAPAAPAAPTAPVAPLTDANRAAGARFGGLDGLRAIAVTLVLIYHLWPSALPGGFLGVDIFFVISGFLITSLLLREWRRAGRIALVSFWRRRARRLIPALALVLLVCTSLALLASAITGNSDLLVNVGAQVFGALVFVSNWVFVALGGDYFARDNPELYRNTWSLSIEEQFYVLLPLLLLFALRAHSRLTRSLLFILLSVGSAALMVAFAAQGENPTRIYFGSDTHVFGLFAGVSLAVLLEPVGRGVGSRAGSRSAAAAARALSPAAQFGLTAAAVLGLGTVGWLAFTLVEGSPASFEGGFQLASVAALLAVWAVTRPGAWIGRWLDNAPMRWVGERSYGLYLWHWPLLLLVPALLGGGPPVAGLDMFTAVIVLALTVACAALSYRYIEQPVRRIGFLRSLRIALRPRAHSRLVRVTAIALAALLVVTVPATATALALAPTQSSAADAITRGQQAQRSQAAQAAHLAFATRGVEGLVDALDGDLIETARPPIVLPPATEAQRPEPAPGDQIFAVGDSVMLASLPELQVALPGIAIDADVSRSMSAGVGIVGALADQGALRPVLVVGLGTNGPVQVADLERLLAIAAGRPIVLVNAHADRWWIADVNATLAAFAQQHRGVVLADWTGAVAPYPETLAGDGIHPNPSGGEIYAAVVRDALLALQRPSERLR